MAKKLVFDKLLFTVIILLVGTGLVAVYSASAAIARDHVGANPFLVRQAFATIVGLLAMVCIMHVDYRRLGEPGVVYALLGGVMLLLVAVLFAPELNNTRRWFFIGGLSVQPSELAKLAVIPFLAYQIARKEDRVNQFELLVPALAVTGLAAGLIVLEPDLGTALLLCATAFTLLFIAGLSWRLVFGALLCVAPVIWVLVISTPYRMKRMLAFLDPEADALGSGYQALQSLIAIGSGGVFGVGPGNSMQKLYFLPYPHSDFIFAILGEETGLVGALLLLSLFGIILWRGVRAGRRAPDAFGRYLAWGFTMLLVLQALINVSVATALLPTKGLPLPFISYGGSSMVTCLAASGVLLNVSQHS
jgi:cell division protein FtsW